MDSKSIDQLDQICHFFMQVIVRKCRHLRSKVRRAAAKISRSFIFSMKILAACPLLAIDFRDHVTWITKNSYEDKGEH